MTPAEEPAGRFGPFQAFRKPRCAASPRRGRPSVCVEILRALPMNLSASRLAVIIAAGLPLRPSLQSLERRKPPPASASVQARSSKAFSRSKRAGRAP